MFPTSRQWPAVLVAIPLVLAGSASRLFSYALEGQTWPFGTTVNIELGLGAPKSGILQDGFLTFNASAANALALWNQQLNLMQFSWSVVAPPGGHGDGQNQAFFASTIYGQTFGSGVIATTLIHYNGTTMLEGDTVFNSSLLWDSYRGPIQYDSKKRQYVFDFHRVAIHEFGHTLGLDHPDEAGQTVTAIMNSHTSDLDHLADDDIAGIKWLYGSKITSSLDPLTVIAGSNFSYQITANNNPKSYAASGLPPDLHVNAATGEITGVPTVPGQFNILLSATGLGGAATATLSLNVTGPHITSSPIAFANAGNSFNYQITVSFGGKSYAATGLPAGLLINSNTGVISGTPTESGQFNIQLLAHTDYGDVTGQLTLHVNPPQVASIEPEFGTVGDSASIQITLSVPAIGFTPVSLPDGFFLDPNTGIITGIPTLRGNYNFDVIGHTNYGDVDARFSLFVTRASDVPIATLPIAGTLLCADPARPRVYAYTNDGAVAVLDSNSLSVVATIPITGSVNDMSLSVDNAKLWLAKSNEKIGAIDLNQLVTIPPDLQLTESLYSIREGLNGRFYGLGSLLGVAEIDGSTGATIQRFNASGSNQPAYTPLEITPDRKTLFVMDHTGGNSAPAARYDISQPVPHLLQSTVLVGGQAGISVNHAGTTMAFITYDGSSYLAPLRSTSDMNVILGELSVPVTYSHMMFDVPGELIFGFVGDGDGIGEFDAHSRRLIRTIATPYGEPVLAMAVDPSDTYLFTLADPRIGEDVLRIYPTRSKPLPSPAPKSLANVSTRMMVGTGDNVEIGGFIIKGTKPKKIAIRAIAPSLSQYGVTGSMADPVLELHDGSGAIVTSNDNWNSYRQVVISSGLAPIDEHESVIITTLGPGNYTAVLRGLRNTTGVALFELYDIDPMNSKVANISTRGNVGVGDNVMIGGFIVGGAQPTNVIIRALGPTLTDYGVTGALVNPSLELHDGNGAVIAQNDDWKSTQQAAIQNSGYAPPKDVEAAILTTLQPGNYTAIVRGNSNTTGVALVEVYNLDAN